MYVQTVDEESKEMIIKHDKNQTLKNKQHKKEFLVSTISTDRSI